jgi:uncharacterized membrane protein YidH (DUF202 family)
MGSRSTTSKPTASRLVSRRAAGWALTIVDGLVVAVAVLVVLWHDLSSPGQLDLVSMLDAVTWLAVPIVFVGMGALLITRVPGNATGWLLMAFTTVLATSMVLEIYIAVVADPTSPGVAAAAWLDKLLYAPAVAFILAGVPLTFPTGRLLGPRWRVVVALVVVAVGLSFLQAMFTVGELSDLVPGLTNPLGLPGAQAWLEVSGLVTSVLALSMFAASLAAVVIRYRRGDPTERQQIKLLAAAVAFEISLFVASGVQTVPPGTVDILGDLTNLGLILIPISIGIAILRYRLYDIDRIISRTIAWALVTGSLVAAFVGLVIGLTALLGSLAGGSTFAVAGSTLVVFALFQPLRRRIQILVDRRFDRARYDSRRTAEAFAERLRNDVDLASVQGDLLGVVVGSLQPASVAVWTRSQTDGVT